jgi:uncharacterized protein YvpB
MLVFLLMLMLGLLLAGAGITAHAGYPPLEVRNSLLPQAADETPVPSPTGEALPGSDPYPLSVTLEITSTVTVTPTQESLVNFLPLILRAAAPTPTPTPTPPPVPRKLLVCASPNVSIPDNDTSGRTVSLNVSDPGMVEEVRVYVRIDHPWVGDLSAQVGHLGLSARLFDRPGVPVPDNGLLGCGLANIRAIFDEGMAHEAENACFNSYYAPAIGGSFYPQQSFNVYFGQPVNGIWDLRVRDLSTWDIGTLVDWCLDFTVLDGVPVPTPTPDPGTLPGDAWVSGMSGQNQAYPLDCESRSAVDWARHWGISISESEFLWGLPTSVNPELGFVGNVYGYFGQVPPNDYGVHAAPIAERLRQYGLKAQARKYLRWDDLRAELAHGRPVIVWIIDTISPGAPRYYNPGTGPFTVTAPYEHTMILVGYTSTTVTLLDGATFRTLSLNSFLDSWSALANMAVIYVP